MATAVLGKVKVKARFEPILVGPGVIESRIAGISKPHRIWFALIELVFGNDFDGGWLLCCQHGVFVFDVVIAAGRCYAFGREFVFDDVGVNARVREVDAMTSVARLILVLVDRNALDKFFVFQFMRPL